MYKKITAIILAVMTVIGMAACGDLEHSGSGRHTDVEEARSTENESDTTGSGDDSGSGDGESVIETGAYVRVGSKGARAVYEVYMYSPDVPLAGKVTFTDLYGVHVLHTGVVGRVGAPVEVDYSTDDVKGGTLLFNVMKNEMNGVRSDALMFMWYDEENDNYVELEKDTKVEDEHDHLAVSVDIDRPGVYLLVNKYEWYNTWGAGYDDNGLEEGYEPEPVEDPFDQKKEENLSIEEKWRKNEYTGDIIDLADFRYMDSCLTEKGAEFNVETPEQLAAACYYVNCCEEDVCKGITVNLTADIDLSGVAWATMGWWSSDNDNRFQGVFNGNGHTISNLKVETDGYAGFFGGTFGCAVKELNIVDADIKGSRNAAVLSPSDVRSYYSDIYVSGVTSSDESGTMLGDDAAATVFNCRHEVLADGSDLDGELSFSRYKTKLLTDRFGRPEKIYFDGDYVVRPAGIEDKYHGMQWYFEIDGNLVYEGINDERLSIKTILGKISYENTLPQGRYTVSLNAFVDGEYIQISNELEIDTSIYYE